MADSLNSYLQPQEREREKVVLSLSQSIHGRHHQLYYDNYFSSISLLEKLLAQNTYACGTIRVRSLRKPKSFIVVDLFFANVGILS